MKVVNLYKTNVDDRLKAEVILDEIRRDFPRSHTTFDLEDCDRVLRIESLNGGIDEEKVRSILRNYGYQMKDLV